MNDHFESFRRCIEALNESGTLEMNMQVTGATMRLRCTITLRSNTMSSHVALVFFTSCATTFSRIFRHRCV